MSDALVLRADARSLPLPPESIDLIITSPPYFALRSYRDGDEHYDGQIGSEPSPQAFLEALWAVTAECWRVLKPTGSMWVNLGDKRAGSGGHNNAGLSTVGSTLQGSRQQERTGMPADERLALVGRSGPDKRDVARREVLSTHRGDALAKARATRRNAPDRYTQQAFGRHKSKMLLPHRYAIGCEDGLADPDGIGWIVRQDQVWSKPNGLPESVTDRTADRHEYWFHLTKEGRYFAATDEIRDPYAPETAKRYAAGYNPRLVDAERLTVNTKLGGDTYAENPLGKLPGSVWSIPSEPLVVPDWLDVEHFAAFPTEWPRRLVQAWSPNGICLECGEGRRPAVDVEHEIQRETNGTKPHKHDLRGARDNGFNRAGYPVTSSATTIIGYVCACTPYTDHPQRRRPTVTPGNERRQSAEARDELGEPRRHGDDFPDRQPVREYHLTAWTPPPTRPAVVLDPFGGTGTVAMVARALGRIGISVDLSADYCRLARWRIFDSGGARKVRRRTNEEAQGALL